MVSYDWLLASKQVRCIGELSEGDQLIEANGVSLVGVSNEKLLALLIWFFEANCF